MLDTDSGIPPHNLFLDGTDDSSNNSDSNDGAKTIDLAREDCPHEDATLEWWYVNGHVRDTQGREYAIFVSFFRYADDTGVLDERFSRAVLWGIVDLENKRYIAQSLVDQKAAPVALARLEKGVGPKDERLKRAIREALNGGDVPLPDVLMRGPGTEAAEGLKLDYDQQTLEKLSDGRYRLRVNHREENTSFDFTFALEKPIVLHGNDGVVSGSTLDAMYYYFCPRCSVEGSITVNGESAELEWGQLWYDHEFGFGEDKDGSAWSARWNWLAIQLGNGWDLTIYDVFEEDEVSPSDHVAVLIAPDGTRHEYREFEFVGDRSWTSAKTFRTYPTRWRVKIPGANLELEAVAAFPEQEFVTYIAKSAFWEGSMKITGTMADVAVKGHGFIERAGFGQSNTLEEFFASVGEATRASVRGIIPDNPDERDVLRITAGDQYPQYGANIDIDQFRTTLLDPIREIVDRGGKAWRSYCMLACCDAVGGDSQPFLPWLALPELLHVGSLIVDDVQDESDIRRGGPACHVTHGQALAINAGNMAYFLPYLGMVSGSLSDKDRLAIFDQYFLAIRTAHVGQALDISGQLDALERGVELGDGAAIEARVLGAHRLKSAAPAAALARIGAILGKGSDAQIEAVGHYHEALGLAFQIVDDVLNLEGFERDLKTRGEDITAGRVTVPVARAMSLLGQADRKRLYDAVAGRVGASQELTDVLELIARSGALDACRQLALDIVDAGWRTVAPLLPNSIHKINLRAFGWFVLDRHY